MMHVSVDYLIKDQDSSIGLARHETDDIMVLIHFRLTANRNTYAALRNQSASTRPDSHDFHCEEEPFTYHDTYIGAEPFAGEKRHLEKRSRGICHELHGPCTQRHVQRSFSERIPVSSRSTYTLLRTGILSKRRTHIPVYVR